jgi:hypothetical protein
LPRSRPPKIDSREVAAGPAKTGDEAKLDRVFADQEDDGNRRSCGLGCGDGRWTRGHDHRDPSLHQFRRQRRQPIDLVVGPAVFDRDVLAFDQARVFQALAECTQAVSFGRRGVEKSDHRHRRLLRMRRERPRRRAAECG